MNRYLTCGTCIAVAEHNNGFPRSMLLGREPSVQVFYRVHNHQFMDYFCTQCLSAECNILYALHHPLPPLEPRTPPHSPPPLRRATGPRSPPGTPPIMQGVGLGGGFSPVTQAPAGETRRNTYVLEEDCSVCFEQDKAGHRMCLRCNGSCCNTCWFKMNMCPLCRCNNN